MLNSIGYNDKLFREKVCCNLEQMVHQAPEK